MDTPLGQRVKDLAVDTGIVTTPVSMGKNTLTDETKNWAVGVHKNRFVKIVSGTGAGQLRVIDGNSDKTLIVKSAWVKPLDTTSAYVILEKDIAQILREVLNAGYDISAAHPLETHDPTIDDIEVKLDGLQADVGDASASALGSLYGILGDPPMDIAHSLEHVPKYTGHSWSVDGTNGDDGNTGVDPCDAFATIGHAISVAAAGDRIYVRAGTYDEALVMNLAGLELVCEQGTILSNTAGGGGTPLVVGPADYQRVVGAVVAQAGQTGIQITGDFCSIEDSLAFGCATGFDDDGLETHFKNTRSISHTTTGFDISAGYGQYEKCIAAGGAAAVTGILLSDAAADHNHFFNCHTLGNTTRGWDVVANADNNMFSHCSTGAGDGAKRDLGTNNTWDEFSEGSQIVAGQTRDQDLRDIYDAAQIRRVASGTSGVIGTGASKYIEIDSGTNGAEILAVIINGVVGFDWTLDVYVPTADLVAAPAAADKRDKITYAAADAEGGLLKPFGIAYNAFLKFTNDNVGDQTITDVVVVYRSRAAITIGAWT